MTQSAAVPPRLSTLVLMTALTVLSLNMFLPSLPTMAATFGVTYPVISLSIAGYLAMTAVLQLVIGPMSDRFGRRPVMLVCLAVFAAASLGCALAADIRVFLTCRLIQGAIVAGWVLSLAVIRDTVEERQAAGRIAKVTMAMAVGPMLGPMFGGVLDDLFGWRSSFTFLALAGAGLFGLCWADLGETNRHPSTTFGAQFRAYPGLLRSVRFWGFATCMMFSASAFYAFLAGAPLVAETVLDLPPAALGIYMGSITGGFLVGTFLSGRLAARTALTTMMLSGRLVACAGLLGGLAAVAAGGPPQAALFVPVVLVGFGNGLTMPSCNAGVLSVDPRLAGSAAGLAGALTLASGAALTTLTGFAVAQFDAAVALLGIMLFCSAMGLIATLAVRRADRRDAALGPIRP